VLLLLLPGSYITANGFGQFFTHTLAIYAETDIINSALQIILPVG